MQRKGILFVLSGPSGAGKGTVLSSVFDQIDNMVYSTSVTTRPPRAGEINGVNYWFVSESEFARMVENGEFLEHINKYGNRYGTLKRTVDDALMSGNDVVLEIETIGAEYVRKIYKDAVLIFITPSNPNEIRRRLDERRTEDTFCREERLRLGEAELNSIVDYNYIAINDDLNACVEEVKAIIKAERAKITNNEMLVNRLLTSIKAK
ncbi:MAG: guanylate kinase [Christensenellales bacterium]|jgi:guanylate kinase